jgi:hypothetical protein
MPKEILLAIKVAHAIRDSDCMSWLHWSLEGLELDVISLVGFAAARTPREAVDQYFQIRCFGSSGRLHAVWRRVASR